jgi:hypothetical protein
MRSDSSHTDGYLRTGRGKQPESIGVGFHPLWDAPKVRQSM